MGCCCVLVSESTLLDGKMRVVDCSFGQTKVTGKYTSTCESGRKRLISSRATQLGKEDNFVRCHHVG